MAVILHIETSTQIGSVCISQGGEYLAGSSERDQKSHSARINPMISSVLQEAGLSFSDLDAVSYSCGPGSYTGLRIGLSTAKGLCFRLNIPLISVSSLAALATEALKHSDSEFIIPMIDARRDEVFCAVYNREGKQVLDEGPLILSKDSFEGLELSRGVSVCGNAAKKGIELLRPGFSICDPMEANASFLIPIAEKQFVNQTFANIAYEEPNYLKAFHTTKKGPFK